MKLIFVGTEVNLKTFLRPRCKIAVKNIGCRFIKKQQILNVLFQQMPRKASFLFYTNIHT